MKPSRIAKLLGVDQKTITNWTDHKLLQRFFTEDARNNTRQREYSENDVLLLNTIRAERARNTSWEEIESILENGNLNANLPASSLLVETAVPAVQYERFLALMNERDSALKEVDRLRSESSAKDDMIQKLLQEIRLLNREIGRLEGQNEVLRDQDDDK